MNKTLFKVIIVVTLIIGSSMLVACATTKSISAGDLAEAKDLDRRFTEAMSLKDLDAAMACFWG